MLEIQKSMLRRWWRLKAGNGEIRCHSESHTTMQSALDGIAAAKPVAASTSIRTLV